MGPNCLKTSALERLWRPWSRDLFGFSRRAKTCLNAWEHPDLSLNDFTVGCEYPPEAKAIVGAKGYEFNDWTDKGMLFAAEHGVVMYEDEKPAVVWTLFSCHLVQPDPLAQLVRIDADLKRHLSYRYPWP